MRTDVPATDCCLLIVRLETRVFHPVNTFPHFPYCLANVEYEKRTVNEFSREIASCYERCRIFIKSTTLNKPVLLAAVSSLSVQQLVTARRKRIDQGCFNTQRLFLIA